MLFDAGSKRSTFIPLHLLADNSYSAKTVIPSIDVQKKGPSCPLHRLDLDS